MAEENRIERAGSNNKDTAGAAYFALKNSVVFPFLSTPLVVGRKKSIDAINNASREHKIIVVVAQKLEVKKKLKKKTFMKFGTACAIKQVVNITNDEIEMRGGRDMPE